MQIDVQTINLNPLRNTYDHLARRFGDKPATRYQEASYDIQASENLHYRPTWDPDQALYDQGITKIVMDDWYALKDPRQYYYNPYVNARARQQENAEANFKFFESRNLIETIPESVVEKALTLLIPLRHAAWGANQNNTFICGYGYGVAFTQPCIYHAMDNFGVAQYLSRIGLILGGTPALERGKHAWMESPAWQPLRKYVEDSMAVRDPFELFVAQNLALDGVLYPLVYKQFIEKEFTREGGSSISLLTQFMTDWFDETTRWIDSVIKTAAKESTHNQEVLADWIGHWSQRAFAAIQPILNLVLSDEEVTQLITEFDDEFRQRVKKTGVEIVEQ